MGLILVIQWKSDIEKNIDWTRKLQADAAEMFGVGFSPKLDVEISPANCEFVIKQVTSGCGTCGNMTGLYRKMMSEFAARAKDNVLSDAEGVSWDLRDATFDELK